MSRVNYTLTQATALLARTCGNRPLGEILAAPEQRGKDRRKYANEIVDDPVHGRFDSRAEHRRWVYLVTLQQAGEITGLERQVRFELVPKQARPRGGFERPVHYLADFVYLRDGARVVEDVKGASTPEYRMKRKLMLWRHGVDVVEIRA